MLDNNKVGQLPETKDFKSPIPDQNQELHSYLWQNQNTGVKEEGFFQLVHSYFFILKFSVVPFHTYMVPQGSEHENIFKN